MHQEDSDLEELKRLLFSKNWRELFPAAAALSLAPGEPPAPKKFQVLREAVLTGRVFLAGEVFNAIASHGPDQAAPVLLQLSRDFPGKGGVIEALEEVAPHVAMIRLTEIGDPIAIWGLLTRVPALRDAITESQTLSLVRQIIGQLPGNRSAAEILKKMDPQLAGPELLASFQQRGPVFHHGMELLAAVAGTAAIPALVAALADPLRVVRDNAAGALVKCGPPALAPVIAFAERGDLALLEPAMWVIRRLRDPSAGPVMRKLLGIPSAPSRSRTAEALARVLGPAAETAIVPLIRSPSRALRLASTRALRDIPTRGAVAELLALILTYPDELAEAAVGSLAVLAEHPLGSDIGSLDALISVFVAARENVRRRIEVVILKLAASRPTEVMAAIDAHIAASDAGNPSRSAIVLLRDEFQAKIVQAEIEREKIARLLSSGGQIQQQQSQRGQGERAEGQRRVYEIGSEGYRHSAHEPVAEPPLSTDPPVLEEDCYFSVLAPESVRKEEPFILEIWCDADDPSEHYKARQRPGVQMRSRGPIPVPSGAVLSVSLSIPGFTVAENDGSLIWRGRSGVVGFEVTPLGTIESGSHAGVARVFLSGVAIASVRFILVVGDATNVSAGDRTSTVKKIDSAFASYATEDRLSVLSRIQGMQKIMPSLDVFLDVLTLRAGEVWRERLDEEIAQRDALFLFWSKAASTSRWVDYEWRKAMSLRGIGFIDPVPLEPPSVAPVPEELASLHFNDWTLNFGQGGTRPEQ